MPIQVFVPILQILLERPRDNPWVGDLLVAIWQELYVGLEGQGIEFSQLSLHSLFYPVPLEPEDTIGERVEDSVRDKEWAIAGVTDEVPSGWCDLENIHVYLHIVPSPDVRAAEKLYKTLWGKELKAILEEISDDEGTVWKYVPKKHIDSLEMRELGYPEGRGLLFRPEYDIALESLDGEQNSAEDRCCGGIVVTGQLGIGKTCFLYYLLFCKLSKKTPVALQLSNHILVFRDDGVLRYPLAADPHQFPEGTWALSDSNDRAKQPCNTFLRASDLRQAWIVQTSPPLEERWKTWSKYKNADMFVMDHFSIKEITALGKVLDLDVGNIRRLYEQWGPSVRTCVRLSLNPGDEILHEENVEHAAVEFVKTAPKTVWFDAMRVSHLLLSIRPSNKTMVGRIHTDMATNRIKTMISYAAAAAEAEDRHEFFHTIMNEWPRDFRGADI
ncbi:hypothetical protein EDB84DRAFT_1210475 [Lactarius hengduanensis]|nr:hypothetical protein EDB84DRAFT_1210475 [Lactarius hengduanensis]